MRWKTWLAERASSEEEVTDSKPSVHEIMLRFYRQGKKDAKEGEPPRPKAVASWLGVSEYEGWMGDAYAQGYDE
jgi:hypothetical protein